MKKMVTILLFIVVAAASIQAAPLNKSRVMKEANWAVHLDYDQFRQSALGKVIQEELKIRGIDQKLDNFAKVFSFHPINDIRNVTLFGQDKDPLKAVVIIEGTCNPETLVALVAMNEGYEKNEYGSYVIHRWFNDKKNNTHEVQYGCFYNSGTLLLSMGKESLQQTIDVLNGKHENAAQNPMFNQPAEQGGSGTIMSVFAEQAGQTTDGIEQAAILRQTDSFTMVLGEQNSEMYMDISLRAKNADEAVKIQQLAQGILALASLSAGDKVPQLNDLLKAVHISCSENLAQLHFKWDSRDLIAKLKIIEQLKQQKEAEKTPAEPNKP